ncbi:MAG: DDE-type integrase/transposase/recombinase [Marinicaulis sp.]|nr:DDE-type integrase/transposase/recombinase [Marinicaulis sp.]NNL90518.1 DDE-type integrase/transposase/recombinase [Marinicaulis sp.]
MLCVTVKPKMGSVDVLEALYPLILKGGKPAFIRSDNGRKFTAEALQVWLMKVGVKPIQICPGSPWGSSRIGSNGYNERFNETLRREVLNAERIAIKRRRDPAARMRSTLLSFHLIHFLWGRRKARIGRLHSRA